MVIRWFQPERCRRTRTGETQRRKGRRESQSGTGHGQHTVRCSYPKRNSPRFSAFSASLCLFRLNSTMWFRFSVPQPESIAYHDLCSFGSSQLRAVAAYTILESKAASQIARPDLAVGAFCIFTIARSRCSASVQSPQVLKQFWEGALQAVSELAVRERFKSGAN